MTKDSFKLYSKLISGFYIKMKRMPSYAEMCKIFGFKSKNAVFKKVNELVAKGVIEKDARGRLLPGSLAKPLKLLGTVQAGFPSPAEEETCDLISLDEYLISSPQSTYLVKVEGDSMVDAGIHPGDLVLVQRNLTARSGDVVVARVDNEWTLKFFIKDGSKVLLKPGNKKYPVITPKNELVIAGVVIANVRKYR